MTHTRSIRRRFFATIVDCVFVAMIFGLLTYPLASSLDSRFRSGMGLVNWHSCGPGQAFLQDGSPVKMGDWQQVQVCDVVLDGVFPYRTANFYKVTEKQANGITTTLTTYIALELDSQNRISFPISLSFLSWILFLMLAVYCEYKWGKTPGKKLLGLAVTGTENARPTLSQALKRNLLKDFLIYAITIMSAGVTIYGSTWLKSFVLADGTIAPLDANTSTLFMLIIPAVALSLLQVVMWLSVIIPWSKAGRGYYDRWVGTHVTRD